MEMKAEEKLASAGSADGISSPPSRDLETTSMWTKFAPHVLMTLTGCTLILLFAMVEVVKHDVFTLLSFCVGVGAFFAGTACILCWTSEHRMSISPETLKIWSQNSLNCFISLFVAFLGCRTVTRVRGGSYADSVPTIANVLNHNSNGSLDYPVDIFAPIVLLLMCPDVFPTLSELASRISWSLCLALLLAALAVDISTEKVLTLAECLIGFGLMALLLRGTRVKMAHMRDEIAQLRGQVHEMDIELNGNALKHMIGNVAHDLKTPLASFVTGTTMMTEMVAEALASPPSDLQSLLHSMSYILSNHRSVASFMIMMINRCLDYTKMSRGVKLVPRYETICVLDTLSLPMQCLIDQEQRSNLTLSPIDPAICTHVITDKQWLQENVMCLLSNAIKYSNTGKEVVLKLSLIADLPADAAYVPPAHGRHKKLVRVDSGSAEEVKPFLQHHPFYDPQSSAPVVASRVTSNQFLLVEVVDRGIGMTDEDMCTLFSPFKQSQRMAGGTGLGLFSLSKRLEALEGSYGIRRRSDESQGSVFWFAIPYRPDDNSATLEKDKANAFYPLHVLHPQTSLSPAPSLSFPTATSREISASTTYEAGSVSPIPRLPSQADLRVLIVDDSIAIQKMMGMMLRRQGHRVDFACNGEEAVQVLLTEPVRSYHIVLMDLQMPVMDGLEATKRIRSEERVEDSSKKRQRQLIVGVSANSDQETIAEALAAGADGFIAKPFSVEGFNAVYQHLTGQSLVLGESDEE